MWKRRMGLPFPGRWLCAFAALLLGLGCTGFAENTSATATIPTLQAFSFSTSSVDFGTLTESDFDTGWDEVLSAQTITVKSNVAWQVTVKAGAATWGFTPSAGDPDPLKPCSDLEWKSSGSYAGLTTTDAQAGSGSAGSGLTIGMDFRMLVSYVNDPPGAYSLTVVYTLSTQ